MAGILIWETAMAAEIRLINPNIPGTAPASQTQPNPVGLIGNLYQFALMLGGVLAFVVIIYAAIRHAIFAGNPSQQSDAKDMIKQALAGLLLLMGAFILLNFLNPKLTKLQIKAIEPIQTPSTTVAGGASNVKECGGANYGYCWEGSCVIVSSAGATTVWGCQTGSVQGGYGCDRIRPAGEVMCAETQAACQAFIANGFCKQGSCSLRPECGRAAPHS